MARQSTPNIGLTYETDKNNTFSYDDDIKNNLITIDEKAGDHENRIVFIEEDTQKEKTIPVTSEDSIIPMPPGTVNGQINITRIRAISSVGPFSIILLKDTQEVYEKHINIQLNPGQLHEEKIEIPYFNASDTIKIASSDQLEITYECPTNLSANVGGLNIEMDKMVQHTNSAMPHLIQDLDAGKTYRYGLQVQNGKTQFIYEEVI